MYTKQPKYYKLPTPQIFENATFDNWIPQTTRDIELLRELSGTIDHNILISGKVGTGKTHLAYALRKAHSTTNVNDKEWMKQYDIYGDSYEKSDVHIVTIKELIGLIRKIWNYKPKTKSADYEKTPEEELMEIKNQPILVIDEMGMQYGSESERIELFDLFNHRWENKLPIIALSNSPFGELKNILGDRILDRLMDGISIYILESNSHRQMGKYQQQ
ncbi:MAG: ATP-binding protein [Rickettsiales bacterium]|jgi:DNA replication protein DnaC|nr:ATP-binding protein [Rickettsiales bacterium]